MAVKRQESYNWAIAMDLFLGGTGAGAFVAGFALEQYNRMMPLARYAEMLGPLFVVLGSVFLLFHAGSGWKTKVYLLFLRPRTSWLSRGSWILSLFVASALVHVFTGGGGIWGWAALVLAVLTAIYPGFLLAQSKAIPIWRTPALPPLFLLSGLSTGVALLFLMDPFFSATAGETASTLRALFWSAAFLIFAQLILLWSYLGMSPDKGAAVTESLRLMRGPSFMVGTLLLGLLLPLALLIFGIMGGSAVGTGAPAGVLLIIGGVTLRFSILSAGGYLPRHSL